jgi:hypothetical protein
MAVARMVTSRWRAIGALINTFSPIECANYFAATGHNPK